MDIGIQTWFHLHPHLRLAAFPRSPFQFLDLAQNERCRLPDFWGAFKFDPVARLYLARPFAVKPPPWETESFSPRPTERLGPFLRFAITVLLSALFCVLTIGLLLLLVFAGNLLASFYECWMRWSFYYCLF